MAWSGISIAARVFVCDEAPSRLHEGGLDAAAHAVIVGRPELLWQGHPAHAAIDLPRKRQLGRLDDAAVDDVQSRRVKIHAALGLRIGDRPVGKLLHRRVIAAVADKLILQKVDLAVEATEQAIVLDIPVWTVRRVVLAVTEL